MALAEHTTIPDRAGTVIVGGGLAGLQVAKELDQRGGTGALVLEAGPATDLRHVNTALDPDTALRMWVEPDTDPYFWRPWISKSEPHYAGSAGLRRRLGGRSLYWHGVILPQEPWALCEPWWPAAVVRDLTESWQGGPSLYQRVHDDLESWRLAGDRPATPAEPLEIGGYRLVETPQAARGIATGGGPWAAYSPAYHWAGGVGTGGTVVAPGVEVLAVTVKHGAANGVLIRGANGRPRHVDAARVVLAAGTIENTRLAVQALHEAGGPASVEFNGLVDHITQGFLTALRPHGLPARLVDLADRDSFFFAPAAPRSRSNLFVRLYRNLPGAVLLDVWTMGEQMPGPDSGVQCVPSQRWPWEVVVHAGLGEEDRTVVAAQRDELREFWLGFCASVNLDPGPRLEFPAFEAPDRTLEQVMPGVAAAVPDDVPVTWSGPLGSEYHEAGTLPLGSRVTEDHELVGVDGLYVAGPATFPRIGAANPSMTNLALAKRLAARLPD